MMFWLLALVLLASLAGMGYRQGAIRAAFSTVGIVLGALLAGPLGKLLKPLLVTLGLKNPVLAWVLAPLIVFLVISIAFAIGAYPVHKKADVHFKYHVGDLRLLLWERLSCRVGVCLGLLNGALYIILLSFVIYVFSYWTVQLGTEDKDPRTVRILNWLGQEVQSADFAKVARAIDPLPQTWYEAADVAGLIFQNPLAEARLSRYPALLGLAERPEFQELGSDNDFTNLRMSREPIMKVLEYPKAQAILENPDLLRLIWATIVPELKDLPSYLVTCKSPKYDSEKILGRWSFNPNVTMSLLRRAKPNISSTDMQKWKRWMVSAFAKTSFVAMTDHQAILKSVPQIRQTAAGAAPTPEGPQTLKGQWKAADGKYQLALSGPGRDEALVATLEGDRLSIPMEGLYLAFDRED
jgi:hypothetical protein